MVVGVAAGVSGAVVLGIGLCAYMQFRKRAASAEAPQVVGRNKKSNFDEEAAYYGQEGQ